MESLHTTVTGIPEPQPDAPLGSGGLYRRAGKRVVDVTISAIMLVVLSPLLLIVSALVKLTSHGPVFYRQERVGEGGKVFKIVKFRSMIVNADRIGPGLTSAGDPRVTKVGTALRRLKIDELPQLWNVLKGEMSVVGPRPELPMYVASYDLRQWAVLTVRPGITDSASIAFRWEEELLAQEPNPEQFYRDKVLPHKLALNLSYIENMSLKHDLLLVVRTARSLLSYSSTDSKR
jgi:lipopolysaccharide/colanic/teichoic acid biosynthesis glycosyltransferase